jgi:hypothetical protein
LTCPEALKFNGSRLQQHSAAQVQQVAAGGGLAFRKKMENLASRMGPLPIHHRIFYFQTKK